jgi:apolipoprotein D and lipocalin family protein
MKVLAAILVVVAIIAVIGVFASRSSSKNPLETVPYVDLDRFMGDWYVIANIPTFIETDAHNAVESYRLADDGTIETVFTFRQGGFDGALKRYTPRGFVLDTKTNAEWGMQFVWPIKADYRVIYLDSDYRTTVVGRNRRDYVWIMAREPSIDGEELDSIVQLIRVAGYDTSNLRMVPQRW